MFSARTPAGRACRGHGSAHTSPTSPPRSSRHCPLALAPSWPASRVWPGSLRPRLQASVGQGWQWASGSPPPTSGLPFRPLLGGGCGREPSPPTCSGTRAGLPGTPSPTLEPGPASSLRQARPRRGWVRALLALGSRWEGPGGRGVWARGASRAPGWGRLRPTRMSLRRVGRPAGHGATGTPRRVTCPLQERSPLCRLPGGTLSRPPAGRLLRLPLLLLFCFWDGPQHPPAPPPPTRGSDRPASIFR